MWAVRQLKSPATQLFVQQLVQVLCETGGFPTQMASDAGSLCHDVIRKHDKAKQIAEHIGPTQVWHGCCWRRGTSDEDQQQQEEATQHGGGWKKKTRYNVTRHTLDISRSFFAKNLQMKQSFPLVQSLTNILVVSLPCCVHYRVTVIHRESYRFSSLMMISTNRFKIKSENPFSRCYIWREFLLPNGPQATDSPELWSRLKYLFSQWGLKHDYRTW